MKNIFPFYILLLLLLGCSENNSLKHALELAEDNKGELEKVLEHYKAKGKDDLRYKAAVFLISNMPGHYSIDKESMDIFNSTIEPVIKSGLPEGDKIAEIERIAKSMIFDIKYSQDIVNITAEYLIYNIEQAFQLWENEKWAKHIGFDDFCELLLPYKIKELQPLDYWRDSLRGKYEMYYTKYENCSFTDFCNIEQAIDLHAGIKNDTGPRFTLPNELLYSAGLIDRIALRNCDDYRILATAVMRSRGLPIAMDYTPQWASRSGGHSWNTLLMNDGRLSDFLGGEGDGPGIIYWRIAKKAKVYRYTYSRNSEIVNIRSKDNYAPPFIDNVFIKDVTGQYMKTCDMRIKAGLNKELKNKVGYLALFDDTSWEPVAYGERKGNNVTFKDVGLSNIFLPIFTTPDGDKQFNYPFKLDYNGKINFLIPDTTNLLKFTFNRKYPVHRHTYKTASQLIGGRIEAANKPDFSDAILVYEQKEWLSENAIRVDTVPPRRYWRYYFPDNGRISVSEMMFMNLNDSTLSVKGKIIGTDGSRNNNDAHIKEAMFDGDLLTCFISPENSDYWVGMDFEKPIQFSKIVYYPRTDGNNIEIGDTYELFYMGDNGWISLGQQVAEDIKITYSGIPSSALYLLDNKTKGVEKRIFTIENGKQVWW